MARNEVECDVEETTVEAPDGRRVDGVKVTCPDCGDTATAMGTEQRSINYALMQLRQNCGMGRNNFYVAEKS